MYCSHVKSFLPEESTEEHHPQPISKNIYKNHRWLELNIKKLVNEGIKLTWYATPRESFISSPDLLQNLQQFFGKDPVFVI